MKTLRFCIFLFALFCSCSLLAQEEYVDRLLFPQFEEGIVFFKNGARTRGRFNYSMLQQKMMFMDEGDNMKMFGKMPPIGAVYIGERIFFPISSKGVYYEQLYTENGTFFVQHKAEILRRGRAAPFGGYSQTSSVTSVGSIYTSIGYVDLEIDTKTDFKNSCLYYIKSGERYKQFNSARSLGKLFKGQTSKIEAFAKANATDFSNTEDVFKIVEFAFSQTKNTF